MNSTMHAGYRYVRYLVTARGQDVGDPGWIQGIDGGVLAVSGPCVSTAPVCAALASAGTAVAATGWATVVRTTEGDAADGPTAEAAFAALTD